MSVLAELKEARDNTIHKARIINTQEVGATRGQKLLGEITIELGIALDRAIEELEKEENRYEFLEPLGSRWKKVEPS